MFDSGEEDIYQIPEGDVNLWPGIGQDNVMGGGGLHSEVTVPVPPNASLYGSPLDAVPGYVQLMALPGIALLVLGFALGFVVVKYNVLGKIKAKLS